MKPSIDQELIHRYLDGELDPAARVDLERRLAAEPGLRQECDQLARLGKMLQQQPAAPEPPYPDFFNAHLLRQIEQEQAETGAVSAAGSAGRDWFGWLRLPWLVAAGATALAVFSLVRIDGPTGPAPDPGRTSVVSTYAPEPGISSSVYFVDSAGATVIELTGLDDIPDEQNVSGRDLGSHESGRGLAVTLLDTSGRPVAALMADLEDGAPVFRPLSPGGQG